MFPYSNSYLKLSKSICLLGLFVFLHLVPSLIPRLLEELFKCFTPIPGEDPKVFGNRAVIWIREFKLMFLFFQKRNC